MSRKDNDFVSVISHLLYCIAKYNEILLCNKIDIMLFKHLRILVENLL